VIAICGDGGALFTAQELTPAVHYGIHEVLIVFNDGGYRFIGADQRRIYRQTYAGALTNQAFAAFVRSVGALRLRAAAPEELQAAVRSELAAARPAVIEVQGAFEAPSWHEL